MDVIALSAAVILIAELGDKSQLIALAFAARNPALIVLLGVSGAALVLSGISVGLGSAVAAVLPADTAQLAAGIGFLIFAAWTLRGEGERHDRDLGAKSVRLAVVTIFATFFVAELGDKTMLATAAMAARQEPVGTWLGASLGIIGADAIAIAVGRVLGARVPERQISRAASALFFVLGILFVLDALSPG